MDILFTVPQNVIQYAAKHREDFPGITGMYSDPPGHKLGSGGGTVNVLWKHYLRNEIARGRGSENKGEVFYRRGSVSLSIPTANAGVCLPIPHRQELYPFSRVQMGSGQRIDQTLADIQRPCWTRYFPGHLPHSTPGCKR